ncbi:unnamed protein product [Ilex paraguariensis]|uniref:Uncharacterized protein n=1 Tax=Ilex paraguariensis TaxID=185542 RepID=A0ABC8T293_9AQUA
MYARTLKSRNKKWSSIVQPCNFLISPSHRDYTCSRALSGTLIGRNDSSQASFIRSYMLYTFSSSGVTAASKHTRLHGRSNASWKSGQLRPYSSEGDGRNASDDKQVPVKDGSNPDKGKVRREKVKEDVKQCDAHAHLTNQDQKEWLNNEKLAIESKKKESPFLCRRERFKNEFLRRIVPWEKLTVSWETFPYYIHEHTKNLLVECAAAHLKHRKFTAAYGARLTSSSGRILLQSIPGTELYRERLVRALARDLQVPLLVLDNSVLSPYDFGEDCSSENESDDDSAESGVECSLESEVEDENEASNEEESTSSGEARSDCSDNDEVDVEVSVQASAKSLKKLVPYNLEDFERVKLVRSF